MQKKDPSNRRMGFRKIIAGSLVLFILLACFASILLLYESPHYISDANLDATKTYLYSEPLPIPDFISINPPPNSEISNETEVFISVLPGVLGLEDINSTMASTMIRINNVIYEDIYKRNNFNYVDIGPHGSEQYTTSFTLPQGQDDIVLLRLEFSRNVLSRKIDGIYSYEWVYKVNQN